MRRPNPRRDAIRAGRSRYFTGKPCKKGHITEREVTSGHCVECRNARYGDPHPLELIYGRKLNRGEKATLTKRLRKHMQMLSSLPPTDPRFLKFRRQERALLDAAEQHLTEVSAAGKAE